MAISYADALARANGQKTLVIAVDALSRKTNYKDRNTCVLFGDGSAAVFIEPADEPRIKGNYTVTQGEFGPLIKMGTRYAASPFKTEKVIEPKYLTM
ncbi:MAG: hypothetical protein QXG00_03730 [Candidatus Woesearchaeota archaeon]